MAAAELNAGADFGPASDTLTLTFFVWAEAAQLGTLAAEMSRPHQATPLELVIGDSRPIHQWVTAVKRLVPKLYEHDADMARRLEVAIDRLAGTAASLDCIGTDDLAAPEVGAATDRVTAYVFRRWPELEHELGKTLARADQLLGRREFLGTIGGG